MILSEVEAPVVKLIVTLKQLLLVGSMPLNN
jgi:hypothetical protein